MTCTLGEVKNRADFVLYWGGNPAECHPRHFTKYSLMPKGKFTPNGRKDRTMVLIDIRETPSAKAADVFLQIRPGKDFELVTVLRALIKNQRVDEAIVAEIGLSMEQLHELVAEAVPVVLLQDVPTASGPHGGPAGRAEGCQLDHRAGHALAVFCRHDDPRSCGPHHVG